MPYEALFSWQKCLICLNETFHTTEHPLWNPFPNRMTYANDLFVNNLVFSYLTCFLILLYLRLCHLHLSLLYLNLMALSILKVSHLGNIVYLSLLIFMGHSHCFLLILCRYSYLVTIQSHVSLDFFQSYLHLVICVLQSLQNFSSI